MNLALSFLLMASGPAAADSFAASVTEEIRGQIPELRARLEPPAQTGRPRGCFQKHIENALAINRYRLPRYSSASGGASERVSKRLIGLEILSLWAARYFDRRSDAYRAAGVPVLCDDFAPMSGAPAFETGKVPPPPRLAPELGIDELGAKLRGAIHGCGRADCFAATASLADKRLRAIAGQPDYYCMTRHILESIRRAADLAPRYDQEARARGMSSPYSISRQFIWTQAAVIGRAWEMDQWAMPVQEKGVPILCRDVPPIPR